MQSDKRDFGKEVRIGRNVRINVSECFKLGDRSVINDNAIIEGRHIEIGKEAWIAEYAHIGGGSCFDYQSCLKAGDFLHMGRFSHINTARRVIIGDECGVGIGTRIFTHGAYLSAWEGFPVQFDNVEIGDRVWLPNAWVNPGVRIGNDVLVAAMSLVNSDLPNGCFAGGIPAKILKVNAYPRKLTEKEKEELVRRIALDIKMGLDYQDGVIKVHDPTSKGETIFDLEQRKIIGIGNEATERVKNQLRRYGIRFRYYLEKGEYHPW